MTLLISIAIGALPLVMAITSQTVARVSGAFSMSGAGTAAAIVLGLSLVSLVRASLLEHGHGRLSRHSAASVPTTAIPSSRFRTTT